jgi:hypothetical protein
MPRYVIVTVNEYHESEPVRWTDGSRHVFHHGGEFNAPGDTAHEILQQLKVLGRSTVKLTSDSTEVPGFDFRCAYTDSVFGLALYRLLGAPIDSHNQSCLVNHRGGAEFRAGDEFTIGELILAEVMSDSLLEERERVELRSPRGADLHVIDQILQGDATGHARISE